MAIFSGANRPLFTRGCGPVRERQLGDTVQPPYVGLQKLRGTGSRKLTNREAPQFSNTLGKHIGIENLSICTDTPSPIGGANICQNVVLVLEPKITNGFILGIINKFTSP